MVNECTLSNGKLPQGGLPWNNVVRRKSLHINRIVILNLDLSRLAFQSNYRKVPKFLDAKNKQVVQYFVEKMTVE